MCAEHPPVLAQILPPPTTEEALPTGDNSSQDAIPNADSLHPLSDGDHFSSDLHSKDMGKSLLTRQVQASTPQHHINMIHSTSAHANEHLTCLRVKIRNLLIPEDLRSSIFVKAHNTHKRLSRHVRELSAHSRA
jgi:hypothetical protein